MADTAKPSLQATHDSLIVLARYLLEVAARTQAAGATTTTLPIATINNAAQTVTKAVMDLEAWIPPT